MELNKKILVRKIKKERKKQKWKKIILYYKI